ncbi:hypothetical protein [Ectobacillus ponti]|uniref:DUF4870 domain-containing protein n=1 Tax=Ectobacillus ponti TaxID=2961894 RepID=A0AA41X820_9BACI|nr:hypothetical protein [Ectobacillus ponti]MCP8970611.1 hypothetical protein [Ectobacillus ponti]
MHSTKRLVAAGCYFSVLFAPFLFPVVVCFALPDAEVKWHAKRALISHLIPYGSLAGLIVVWMSAPEGAVMAAGTFVVLLIMFLLSLISYIWNLVKGVQLLMKL